MRGDKTRPSFKCSVVGRMWCLAHGGQDTWHVAEAGCRNTRAGNGDLAIRFNLYGEGLLVTPRPLTFKAGTCHTSCGWGVGEVGIGQAWWVSKSISGGLVPTAALQPTPHTS